MVLREFPRLDRAGSDPVLAFKLESPWYRPQYPLRFRPVRRTHRLLPEQSKPERQGVDWSAQTTTKDHGDQPAHCGPPTRAASLPCRNALEKEIRIRKLLARGSGHNQAAEGRLADDLENVQELATTVGSDAADIGVRTWPTNEGFAEEVRRLPRPDNRLWRFYLFKKTQEAKSSKHCHRLSSQLPFVEEESPRSRRNQLDNLQTTPLTPDSQVPRILPHWPWIQQVVAICKATWLR